MIRVKGINTAAKGFTLIETLIAIAIAGIAFFMLSETFFNVLLSLEGLKSETSHQQEVRFVRGEIISLPERDEVEQGGTIPTLDLGDARWEAQITETDVVDLFTVEIRIEFNPPDDDRFVHEESFYVLRPTWSDSLDRSSLREEVSRRILDDATFRDW
jgi:general secretion pathway protein I